MKIWEKLRFPFLVVISGGTGLALIWGIAFPELIKRSSIPPYTFPQQVPLLGWQQLSSSSLPLPENPARTPLAGKSYQYRQNNLILDIQMRYLAVGKSNLNEWLRIDLSLPSSFVVHEKEGIGAYGILAHDQKLYLSSCINPQGKTTVTGQQYFENKLMTDISPTRLFSWLLGEKTFFDQRCLWAHMSLPLKETSQTEQVHQVLREAWASWYLWWQSNFPKS